jgi:hypothetical protein
MYSRFRTKNSQLNSKEQKEPPSFEGGSFHFRTPHFPFTVGGSVIEITPTLGSSAPLPTLLVHAGNIKSGSGSA